MDGARWFGTGHWFAILPAELVVIDELWGSRR
jgi:hypothetical protein